jgi:hypothetical protein
MQIFLKTKLSFFLSHWSASVDCLLKFAQKKNHFERDALFIELFILFMFRIK